MSGPLDAATTATIRNPLTFFMKQGSFPKVACVPTELSYENGVMKHWIALVLLVGAVLGLLGQEAAVAQAVPVTKVQRAVADTQMSPDCAAMMLGKQAQQPEKPCEGMTPDCIAKMGCAVPLALILPLALDASPEVRAPSPPQMSVASLIGRDAAPEPEPPALLG